MMITSGVHIYESTPIHATLQKEQGTGRQYIVLDVGSEGQMMVFVNCRAKALEIASLLESAAQKWEDEE